MIRFTGKCLLIAIVMFVGVLFGMQQANSGMLDMKGYKDPSLKEHSRSAAEKDRKKKLPFWGKPLRRKIWKKNKNSWNRRKPSTCFQKPEKPFQIP